jgi:hypothetical protein
MIRNGFGAHPKFRRPSRPGQTGTLSVKVKPAPESETVRAGPSLGSAGNSYANHWPVTLSYMVHFTLNEQASQIYNSCKRHKTAL